jgi:two-component system sensor histidine kinase KdpD
MSDARRDPDELLRRVTEEERRAKRGKLVVFFGAAPGVGKTYAMLEAARTERDLARDVVIGIVETHGRYETGALVIGLEMLPRRKVEMREGGASVTDFDLDTALARRPGLILMDELAHTNAPGSRHAKRWQDVEELLDAGIDVYTTLNVQHLESVNDVVAQVTGVVVRETVPDRVLEEAIDVRLVDLPPDELLQRLQEGKVYVPEQAARALAGFFRKGNLIALRELALRRTAERVDAQMRTYRTEHGIDRVWPAGERILVGVSPSPTSARLLRATRRLAAVGHSPWMAVYVETPASLRLAEADRHRVAENLRLAAQLGAETATVLGENAAEEMLRYARAHNATRIVVGKPTHPRWKDLLARSFLEEMVRSSQGIDVYVISGEDAGAPRRHAESPPPSPVRFEAYGAGALVVSLATAASWFAFGREQLADVVMVYLLGIIIVATRLGYGPSIAATVLSVLLVDFFFVPPYFSFAVSDFQHIVTFAVMFVVALVISGLTQRIRDQARAAAVREQRTASLYALTRELASTRAVGPLAVVAAQHLHDVFDAKVALFLGREGDDQEEREEQKKLEPLPSGEHSLLPDEKERAVLEWAWANDKPAGLSTDTLPGAAALYVPLHEARGRVGMLAVSPSDRNRFVDPEQRALLDVFASQVASALERARLAESAQTAQLQIETERLRSALLSSISHDLRTPLAVITGAASTLVEPNAPITEEARRDLMATIYEEATRLNRLVHNLLDMTKIASGAIKVNKEWQPLEEVVGAVLSRTETALAGHVVEVSLPADLPLVPIDAVLIEQVLINLLENAAKYSPKGSHVTLSATQEDGNVVVAVADDGPGIPSEYEDKIFEKFYRLPREREGSGAGLGLAICRGIVTAHGGRIWADNRASGGAAFHFTIPIEGTPPAPPFALGALGEEAK